MKRLSRIYNAEALVYSVTNTQGFCTEYFSKDVSSKDKSNYKIVPRGYFAYNPSRINVGSVDWQRNEDRVIVSPLYNVFGVSKELDNQYLYYFIKSDFGNTLIKAKAEGSVRDNLKLSMLAEFPIPLPPLAEQKHIAAVLDKCTEVIAKHKQMLEKYDTLVKSQFVEMFGDNPIENGKWKVEKLEAICTVTSSKRIYAEEQSFSGVPFLRISDLVSRINGIITNELFIPNEKFLEFKKNRLVPVADDILITSRGTLGLCYIVKPTDEFYFQDGMITWLSFENHNKILSLFIDYFFRTVLQKKINTETNGATVKYISISDLKKMQISVPPLTLQEKFAEFVRAVDAQKAKAQKSLDKAETLYKALMQQYFA